MASTPITVALSALGGGMLGWSYSRKRIQSNAEVDDMKANMESPLGDEENEDVVSKAPEGAVEDLDKDSDSGTGSDADTVRM